MPIAVSDTKTFGDEVQWEFYSLFVWLVADGWCWLF
jgi:hypothetical protein